MRPSKKSFLRNGLIILTCAAALLPYLIPYDLQYSMNSKGEFVPNYTFDLLVPILWVVLVVTTLIVGKRERKLFWLLALFPVAFGPSLLMLYIYIHAQIFGFAP
jgi:hypothetical protein